MMFHKVLFTIFLVSLTWTLANSAASNDIHLSRNFISPWLKTSLPIDEAKAKTSLNGQVTAQLSSTKLSAALNNSITRPALVRAKSYDSGIIWKIDKDPTTLLYTVYILHKNQQQEYYCSIYPDLSLLLCSLNKVVSQGFHLGLLNSNDPAYLVNLQTHNVEEIILNKTNNSSNKEGLIPAISLNWAIKNIQDRIQVQKFNSLPSLTVQSSHE